MDESDIANDCDTPDPKLAKLIATFPRLFHEKAPECYSYVSDGWEKLIHALCTDIDRLLPDADAAVFTVSQIKEKWGSLRFYWSFEGQEATVIDLIVGINVAKLQVPPKHPTDLFNKIRVLVVAAENKSKTTCETCGEPGEMRLLVQDEEAAPKGFFTFDREPIPKGIHGWVGCRCDLHAHRDNRSN